MKKKANHMATMHAIWYKGNLLLESVKSCVTFHESTEVLKFKKKLNYFVFELVTFFENFDICHVSIDDNNRSTEMFDFKSQSTMAVSEIFAKHGFFWYIRMSLKTQIIVLIDKLIISHYQPK